jgi:hypothetical protein
VLPDRSTLVCNLQDNYDPANFQVGAAYTPPKCKGTYTNVNPSYLDLIKKVWRLAPPSVKSKLCSLTHFFVITSQSYSPREPLGIWESPDRGANMYIAIPYEQLDAASGPRSLAAEENDLYGRRLLNVNPLRATLPSFTEISGSNTKTPEAAILAVVAHELGHILLADTNADGAGPRGHTRPCPPPDNSGPMPKKSCFGVDFLAAAGAGRGWQQGRFNTRRWINFGNENGNKHNKASIKTIDDLRAEAASSANDTITTSDIKGIYDNDFVSVFAAISPEEDFVETYKYRVLADAGLTNLGLNIPGTGTISVLGRTSTELNRKKSCVTRVAP